MRNRIKVLRAERDWSQGDLAQRLEAPAAAGQHRRLTQ